MWRLVTQMKNRAATKPVCSCGQEAYGSAGRYPLWTAVRRGLESERELALSGLRAIRTVYVRPSEVGAPGARCLLRDIGGNNDEGRPQQSSD